LGMFGDGVPPKIGHMGGLSVLRVSRGSSVCGSGHPSLLSGKSESSSEAGSLLGWAGRAAVWIILYLPASCAVAGQVKVRS
jgi:hypothetical protein